MTIKDIARLSGFGVATVSRVLNHHPDVSEETRRRVMMVVEAYGFQPNNNARHLKQQVGTGIAIVVKETQNMLSGNLVEHIQALLRSQNRESTVCYLDEDANEVTSALQICRERKPRGILFLGGDPERFREPFGQIKVPCVLLTNTAAELECSNLSILTTDDRAAATCAMDHLLSLGHRSVGILGGSRTGTRSECGRVLGGQDSLRCHNIPFGEGNWEPCRSSMQEGYEAAGRLLERNPDLTAIFAVSDVIAIGAIRALKDLGKRIPEDISVVGCDGAPIGNYLIPRLTTVRQDTRLMAEQGVALLLKNMERSEEGTHVRIPFELVPGESAAKRCDPNER